MPRRPKKEGPPLPPYMHAYAGAGMERIGIDDIVWVGDDGNLKPEIIERALAERRSPAAALQLILSVIIRSHPVDGSISNEDRLKVAMEALVPGSAGGAKMGRKKSTEDERILDAFCEQYIARVFGFAHLGLSDTALMEGAIALHVPAFDRAKAKLDNGTIAEDALASRIKRVFAKFREDKDRRLVLMAKLDPWSDGQFLADVKLVLEALKTVELVTT